MLNISIESMAIAMCLHLDLHKHIQWPLVLILAVLCSVVYIHTQVAPIQLANSRVQAGVKLLAKGRVIITDRLHASILANLIGRPLIWIDTKQKKLSGE